MSELNLILLGPPGAGKGTQAERLVDDFDLPYYATGDILRNAVKEETDLGKEAKGYMDKGDLVPDELICRVVMERIDSDEAADGFLLDGFPRTRGQADVLKEALERRGHRLTAALLIEVDDDEVIRRLSGRRTCRGCGKIWHVEFDPTSRDNICDRCGSQLFQRDDDKAETIANRLVEYTEKTAPLVDYYGAQGKLVGIDATGPVEDVTVRAIDALRSYGG